MNRLRGELLPGPALAGQEHGRRSGRDAPELVVELLHRGRGAENVAETAELAQLVSQFADLGAQLAGLRYPAQDRLQPLDVDRLHQIVGRAQAQCLDCALDARVAGDHHYLGRVARLEIRDELDALAVRELQVGEQDVGLQARQVDARRAHRIGLRDAEAFGFGKLAQPFERFGIVVYEKQMGHRERLTKWVCKNGTQLAYQLRHENSSYARRFRRLRLRRAPSSEVLERA